MTRLLRAALACFALPFAGCGGDADASAGKVKVDTLAGGVTRTITTSPIDSGRWQLVLERTVQPAEGEPGELRNPGDLALGDDGTLLVVDDKPAGVSVFDPAGKFLRTIGHEGDGPGEFRAAFIALRGDTLAMQDPRSQRASFFSVATGQLLGQRPTVCCYYGGIGIDAAGRAVAPVMVAPDSLHPSAGFIRFSLDGRTLDTTRVPERKRDASKDWRVKEGKNLKFTMTPPLSARNIHAVDPRGGFLTGWSGEYLLRTTTNGADTVALFGRAYAKVPVSAAEKAAIIEERVQNNKSWTAEASLREGFQADGIPNERPAFEQLAVDRDGHRWVRRSLADTTVVEYDLFDARGVWLDIVRVPAAQWPRDAWRATAWSRDHVAVSGEGDDGRPLVRIFRITRTEGK